MNRWIPSLAYVALLAGAGCVVAQAKVGDFDQQFLAARELAISGQRAAAVQAYTELLQRSPGNADVLLGRGRVYCWMGKWPEAEADLTAATSAAPKYADAWSALGDLYLWTDRAAPAVEAYGQWLALDSAANPAPLIARGRAYRAAGNYVAARADFLAAGARGADPARIEELLHSLTPRALNPRALGPDAVVPASFLWSASLSVDRTDFSPARASWTDYTLSVRRHFDHGSLAVEALESSRFSTSDHAWALDGYFDLWSRAYANVRYQWGPQEVLFPGTAWRGELYQGVGHGWELSASDDHLGFSSSSVDIYGLGIGKYVGNWYLRLRHLYVPGGDSNSNSDHLLVRNYYAGDADNYIELNVGVGHTGSAVSSVSGSPGGTSSWSAGAAVVKFFAPHLGFKLGYAYGSGDDGYDARDVFATVYTRW